MFRWTYITISGSKKVGHAWEERGRTRQENTANMAITWKPHYKWILEGQTWTVSIVEVPFDDSGIQGQN